MTNSGFVSFNEKIEHSRASINNMLRSLDTENQLVFLKSYGRSVINLYARCNVTKNQYA